jgi:hypothetical protein
MIKPLPHGSSPFMRFPAGPEAYPLTAPIMMPFVKYRWKKG